MSILNLRSFIKERKLMKYYLISIYNANYSTEPILSIGQTPMDAFKMLKELANRAHMHRNLHDYRAFFVNLMDNLPNGISQVKLNIRELKGRGLLLNTNNVVDETDYYLNIDKQEGHCDIQIL